MMDILPFLSAGAAFGLMAGISPGPLLAFVISETIQHSKKEGIKVAISPLFTDAPIIMVAVYVLSKLAHTEIALGIIAIAGGVFLCHLGYQSVRIKGIDLNTKANPQSLKKGIVINLLSPHPYLFWLTVGAPSIYQASRISNTAVLAFLLSFYGLLVGSKIGIALIVDRSRNFFKNKFYLWTVKGLGIIIIGFAIYFIKEGLQYFNLL